MPAESPIQAEPVTAATAAAAKAAASILPSRPMSKMPARSEKSPARQARSSGVAHRSAARGAGELEDRSRVHQPGFARAETQEAALDRDAHEVLQRAGEEDDQRLDHDDHVAADLGHVEGELGAALVEDAEEDRGEHDADRCERPISDTAMPTKPAPPT